MRIIWKPNPLESIVELDDSDRRLLRLRLEVDDLQERIASAHVLLDSTWLQSESPEVGKALRYLTIPDDDPVRLDRRAAEFERELAAGHVGDCTCVPCSCLKCYAEHLVGVDTLKGLGKHEAAKVAGAFTSREGGTTPTLDEVISRLLTWRPTKGPAWDKFSDADWQQHVPRLLEEAARAHTWLTRYKAAHFKE